VGDTVRFPARVPPDPSLRPGRGRVLLRPVVLPALRPSMAAAPALCLLRPIRQKAGTQTALLEDEASHVLAVAGTSRHVPVPPPPALNGSLATRAASPRLRLLIAPASSRWRVRDAPKRCANAAREGRGCAGRARIGGRRGISPLARFYARLLPSGSWGKADRKVGRVGMTDRHLATGDEAEPADRGRDRIVGVGWPRRLNISERVPKPGSRYRAEARNPPAGPMRSLLDSHRSGHRLAARVALAYRPAPPWRRHDR